MSNYGRFGQRRSPSLRDSALPLPLSGLVFPKLVRECSTRVLRLPPCTSTMPRHVFHLKLASFVLISCCNKALRSCRVFKPPACSLMDVHFAVLKSQEISSRPTSTVSRSRSRSLSLLSFSFEVEIFLFKTSCGCYRARGRASSVLRRLTGLASTEYGESEWELIK